MHSAVRSASEPEWRNWQTRGTQNPVSLGTCGFDPHLRHGLHGPKDCWGGVVLAIVRSADPVFGAAAAKLARSRHSNTEVTRCSALSYSLHPLQLRSWAPRAAHIPRRGRMDPGMGMGTPAMISRKAFEGYYDGHKDTYLNTDVSDKAQARAMHVNYAPGSQDRATRLGAGDLSRRRQGRPWTTRRLRLRARRADVLADLERDDVELEGERQPRSHHERHADRPPRDARRALRAGDLHPAQLPDRQGR